MADIDGVFWIRIHCFPLTFIVTDPVENQRGHYETLYGHQIIGKPSFVSLSFHLIISIQFAVRCPSCTAFEQWKEACHYGADNANVTQECHDAQSAIFHSLVGPMNALSLPFSLNAIIFFLLSRAIIMNGPISLTKHGHFLI